MVKQQSVSVDQEDGINFEELRKYETVAGERGLRGISLKDYDYFKQNSAARKIQKAWKRYQTKRIIERWVYMPSNSALSPIGIDDIQSEEEK